MKNNNIIYIGLAAIIGLLIGYLIFEGKTTDDHNHSNELTQDQMWTCAMHPQIMKTEPGACPICGMDLIPIEINAIGLTANQFKMTKNAIALANIHTSIVGSSMTNDKTIKLSGKIEENEEANAVQVSYFSGRIEKLNISFKGEGIRKGQLLATIYSPELVAAQQELLTALFLKESQPELYNAVRNKLKLWKLSENQINQIEESGMVKENFPVYATVSGTVSEKLVDQGDYIKQGQPLLKISNLNTVWANFDVYESQINLFKKDQEITITTNAYPNKKYKAKVSFIDPMLNKKTRTVKLRAVLNNITNEFKPGMFVEGKINNIKSSSEQALSIPSTSVLWTGERSVVYVKSNDEEPVFEMREVVVGSTNGDSYQVLSGIENGDEIVTSGTFTVDAAAQLKGKKSMMNKEGGKTMTGHEDHLGMKNGNNNTDDSKMSERIKVPVDFQNQLKNVFNNYIGLKNALVENDSKLSIEKAKLIAEDLDKVNMKLLTNNKAHKHWMLIEKEIKTSVSSISNSLNIEVQRKHFKNVSEYLTTALQIFGINQKVYSQFCPMVNDNKGAYWLSLEEGIRNPYYGEAMLTCGSIKQVIE